MTKIRRNSEHTSGGTVIGFQDPNGISKAWNGAIDAPYIRDLDYDTTVGVTNLLELTTTSAASGKLTPGRYFLQVLDIDDNRAFVRAAPYNVSVAPLVAATGANMGIPMDAAGIIGFEIEVSAGVNDQLCGIMDADTGSLYFTISKTIPSK